MAKSGPKNVNPSSKGSSPTHTPAGGPGGTFAQMPVQKPVGGGPPVALKRALTKKAPRGTATGYAGSLRSNRKS